MSRELHVRNPRTGEWDYTVNPPSRQDLKARCAALRAGQANWEAMGLDGRKAAILSLCDALDRHREPIIEALSADTGRYETSVAELEGVRGITMGRVATAAEALAVATGQSNSDASLRYCQQLVPHTLVGIISPWNYPLVLCMIDAITALLAGSACLLKPSEVTPRFIEPFRAAIGEVEHLCDVLEVVAGDGETGSNVIDLTDMVVFTGSVATGRKVQERAASQFKMAFLELGGNDAAVVLDSADPDTAAEIIVHGAMENSGQLCCAIERVYVASNNFDAVRDAITARMEAQELNVDDMKEGEVGPIILDRQADILRDQLRDALDKGAKVVTGGHVVERDGGLWCEPTVMVDVTHDMKLMTDETFGPIVPIMAFIDTEEAVRLANDTDFGLSATVIGEEEAAVRVGERMNAGGLWINDFDPMGGVGDVAEKTAFGVSGLGGSRYGYGGFHRFLRKKALVIRSNAA